MKKRCTQCTESFTVTPEAITMLGRLAPVVGGKTLVLPEPTCCPDCRQQRRLTFRNDSHYYKNTCVSCKKSVISIYSPDKNLPVLCPDCFWSDQWDALAYGRDFDFSKSYAEQFAELKKIVPRLCIFNTQSDNADYTVHSSRNKNCYMCSSTLGSQDVYFSDWSIDSSDSSDLLMCSEMELCYACNDSRHCFNGDWLDLCSNVSDSCLCFDCHSSQDLVGCVSMKNKKNMILNKPSDQKTVKETIDRLKTDRAFRESFQESFHALKLTLPKRAAWNLNTEDASGNYLQNAKGVHQSFSSTNVEDCEHVYDVVNGKNCMDVTRGGGCESLYECKGVIDLTLSCFCNLTYQCDNLLYCDNAHASSYCFGCFSTKKVKHCILNKQYTKEEYESLVPRIIEHMKSMGEWGEFFPTTLSSFGYNETKAYESFPMTRNDVLKRGWQWSDIDETPTAGLKVINAERLPDTIKDVPDDILNLVIASEASRKPFRIIPQELAFYRKKNLPLPHLHPHERLRKLALLENPKRLYERTCDKCSTPIETTYAPERPEIVYCEECYLKEVY